MTLPDYSIEPESHCHESSVEHLTACAFGPGRFARSAFRLREGVDHEPSLSFVALEGDELLGSVRLTRIRIGSKPALVLGPLVVSPKYKNCGIGARLMRECVEAAKNQGENFIILVGDLPYYQKFGFERVPGDQISLPGPADPARILYCELNGTCLSEYQGKATRWTDGVESETAI